MEIRAEIQRLEDSLAGKAEPILGPYATLGRLAELYLKLPEPSRYADRALAFARIGVDLVTTEDPLYPKLRHFEAMAMRLCPSPEEGVLGAKGKAAEMERDTFSRMIQPAPAEAYLLAAEWGNWAWERSLWDEAAEAYSMANRAMRRHLLRHFTDRDERLKLLYGNNYAARSAFAYVQLKRPREAILELERASSIHFGTPDDRRLLDRLREEHTDVAARFDAIDKKRRAFMTGTQGGFAIDDLGRFSAEAVAADLAFDAIVQEIRGMEGFGALGTVSDWQDVAKAAQRAPLVHTVLTDKGVAMTATKIDEKGDVNFSFVILNITDRDVVNASRPFFIAEFESGTDDRQQLLLGLLRWLGDSIGLSIYSLLKELGHVDGPFAIIPTGLLAHLPLHASMRYNDETGEMHFLFHPRNVTYAYWARGLAHSLGRYAELPKTGSLVVNNPQPLPATYDPLWLTDFESEVVRQHVPGVELKGPDANTEAVVDALPQASLVHFCCHGSVARDLNYSGILLLANNEIFTYKHLRDMPSLAARLVVLSACRSGSSALGLDPVLSLPALFMSAGAAAVLGTFWHTDDMATYLLMTRFYSLWCDGGMDPSRALGEAQAWLMSATAAALRDALPRAALASPSAAALISAADDDMSFRHPWYWSAFFLAGI